MRQLVFQFLAPLTDLAGILLGAFATPGLLGQRFRQRLELLLHFELRRVQLLGSCLQPGLFRAGARLLYPHLFLRCFQLALQPLLRLLVFRQFGFQLATPLAFLARLLLDPFTAPGLFRQRFRQPLDLLLHFDLR